MILSSHPLKMSTINGQLDKYLQENEYDYPLMDIKREESII